MSLGVDSSYLFIGGGFAALIATLLSVAFSNHRSASALESKVFELANLKQERVMKPALMLAISKLPTGIQNLSAEQWDTLYAPIDAYTAVDRLNAKVMTIRDSTNQSIYIGALCAVATFGAGVLFALGNSLSGFVGAISGVLLVIYLSSMVSQSNKIRGLERINRRLLTSESTDALKKVADEALSKYFS